MNEREELEALRRLVELESRAKLPQEAPEPNRLPGFALGMGKDVLRGAGMALDAFERATPVQTARGVVQRVTGQDIPIPTLFEGVKDFLAPDPGRTGNEKRLQTALESAGGALLAPAGGAAQVGKNVAAGAFGGLTGNLAGEAAAQTFDSPNARKYGEIAGSLLGGGAAGYFLGPRKTTTPEQDVKRDTGILTGVALDRVGPRVDAGDVANQTADAANAYLRRVNQLPSDAFTAAVQGQSAPRLVRVYQDLRRLAAAEQRPGPRAALEEVADSLINSDRTGFLRDLPDVSRAVKAFKERPPNPNAPFFGAQITAGDRSDAYRVANQLLQERYPAYATANQEYGLLKNTFGVPAQEGPMGRIADRNPNLPAPTPEGRLGNVVQGRTPEGVGDVMSDLQRSGADPQAIARVLIQKQLESGSRRPQEAVFGAPGAEQGANMEALLRSAGRDPRAIRTPLAAAESRAATIPEPQVGTEYISAHPRGISLRGIFRPGSGDTQAIAMEQYKRQIAEILASGTPAEKQRLRELAMFDPNMRAIVSSLVTTSALRAQGD